MNFYVTHIIKKDIPQKGLIEAEFISSTVEDINKGVYYIDSERIEKDDIIKEYHFSELIALERPTLIDETESVFIDSELNMYKGKQENPFKGMERIF